MSLLSGNRRPLDSLFAGVTCKDRIAAGSVGIAPPLDADSRIAAGPVGGSTGRTGSESMSFGAIAGFKACEALFSLIHCFNLLMNGEMR